jgi:putative hydrolase of the HAD superfamily
MKHIKNIIFDYGNVIFEIDFGKAQESFRNLGIKDVESVFAHSGQNPLFDNFDKGLIEASEFRNGVRQFSGMKDSTDEEIDRAWNSLLIGVPTGNHDLLLGLKNKYRTFLLSNNNEIHYSFIMDYLKRNYELENNSGLFEKDYYSHLMGMRKPNKVIFERVIDEQGLIPEETLFIDDSPQHLKTAEQLGFKIVLFNKPKELKKLIGSLGL